MSNTYTSRTSVSSTSRRNNTQTSSDNLSRQGQVHGLGERPVTNLNRGRGRGTGLVTKGRTTSTSKHTNTVQNRRMDYSQGPGYGASSSPQRIDPQHKQERETEEQGGQYAGGYTMYGPNIKNQQRTNEIARKETEDYEKHKQKNTMKYCNYVGTTGGGELSEEMVRRRQANNNRAQKFNRLQNQQKRRQEQREAEQREIDLKRTEARRKAEENAKNSISPDRVELRRKREGLLQRVESQGKTANK